MMKQVEQVWEDREIRFDSSAQLLACRRGEKVIDSINSVEDTKGNNGERGSLIITNLRLLWVCHSNSTVNLSIGLNTILSINIRKARSKIRGHTQVNCFAALYIRLSVCLTLFSLSLSLSLTHTHIHAYIHIHTCICNPVLLHFSDVNRPYVCSQNIIQDLSSCSPHLLRTHRDYLQLHRLL